MPKKEPKICAECKKPFKEGHYTCGDKDCKQAFCATCYSKHPCDKV